MNRGRLWSSRIITLIRSVFSWEGRPSGPFGPLERVRTPLEGGAFSSRSDPVEEHRTAMDRMAERFMARTAYWLQKAELEEDDLRAINMAGLGAGLSEALAILTDEMKSLTAQLQSEVDELEGDPL